MSTITSTADALTQAIEARAAEDVAALFAEEATFTLLDRDHPPAAPQIFHGREEIVTYYRDICGRNMEHQIRDAVSTEHGLAYTQHCRYPDGAQVVCSAVATVEDGRIVSQTAVQVWDS